MITTGAVNNITFPVLRKTRGGTLIVLFVSRSRGIALIHPSNERAMQSLTDGWAFCDDYTIWERPGKFELYTD